MSATVFLFTPPFTQLNTPYPATPYLKGFLNTRDITCFQADLGIETTLSIFCAEGLKKAFSIAEAASLDLSDNAYRILSLQNDYIRTIDAVITFLQGKDPMLAPLIASGDFLPEASRFAQLDDMEWAFGNMSIQDKAKHLGTMYLEDLSDFIKECIDPHFGFSRYAERIARSATQFDELYNALQLPYSFVDEIYLNLLGQHIRHQQPQLVGISVPFPGNLYSSLRGGQFIKKHFPHIKVVMGGGFANTELRAVKDPRVFEFYDYITLDDGEAPLENLIQYIQGNTPETNLKRSFLLKDGAIQYNNNTACSDYKQGQVGTPDYSDLLLDKYISAIEVANPMHSLWSDGRWNKLTMAHGCYWGKCTFCDTSLDYIQRYEPLTAAILCDRMEDIIKQTGQRGFHFVDEAAPPALMRSLALEIIRRKLVVSWWTNIRFEKSFTRDLCLLLKASGCIAVSGGLEVASDRLLALIQKGVTVAQVAKVNRNFTEAGIMVHAYLMYGFPTQTAQETIDSLEMVRQMFEAGILQSAFWHQFAMTAHSPVGMSPDTFNVKRITGTGDFANNDLVHTDPTGADHDSFSYGLKKSLYNYMHDACLDFPLSKWFDFKVPKTSIVPDFIEQALSEPEYHTAKPNTKVVWIGKKPRLEVITKSKKGSTWQLASIDIPTTTDAVNIKTDLRQGEWLVCILGKIAADNLKTWTLQEVITDYEAAGLENFELFWDNKPVNTLHEAGLLHL